MKKSNVYIILFLMMFLMLTTLTIGKTHAFSSQGVDITIHEDGTYSQDNSTDEVHFHQESNYESYNTYLMFEDETKLTYRYLLDNPDFSITFTNMSESGGSLTFRSSDINHRGFKSGTISSGQSITLSSESKIKYHTYATSKTLSEWFTDRSSELEPYLDLPVVVFSGNVNNPWTLTVEGNIINKDNTENEGSGGVVDGTEGENDSSILGEIKDFFNTIVTDLKDWITGLFQPITDGFAAMEEVKQHKNLVFDMISDSITSAMDRLLGFTFVPIMEFFGSIDLTGFYLISKFWEFPIVKEFTTAAVAVLVVTGIIGLLISL